MPMLPTPMQPITRPVVLRLIGEGPLTPGKVRDSRGSTGSLEKIASCGPGKHGVFLGRMAWE